MPLWEKAAKSMQLGKKLYQKGGHLYLQDHKLSGEGEWWLIPQRETAAYSRFQLAVYFVV